MSATPRTDQAANPISTRVRTDFARKLETELNAAITALVAVTETPHFYDMPEAVQNAVNNALDQP